MLKERCIKLSSNSSVDNAMSLADIALLGCVSTHPVRDYPSNAISADEITVLNNATCGNYRIVVNTERSVMREYSSYNL